MLLLNKGFIKLIIIWNLCMSFPIDRGESVEWNDYPK